MRELIDEYGLDVVQAYMQHIQVGVAFSTHKLVQSGLLDYVVLAVYRKISFSIFYTP